MAVNDLQGLLARTAALHHRLCPRQVLGVRMGMQAGVELALDLPQTDKRLFAFMETDGCAADGVSVATGCWIGRRTMRVLDFGKVATTFVDTITMKAVRIHPHPLARQRSLEYAPEAPDRWHAQLAGYQAMPAGELLIVQHVNLLVDLQRILSRPNLRVSCDHCGEEIMNAREVSLAGETVCLPCAGDVYYRVHGDEGSS